MPSEGPHLLSEGLLYLRSPSYAHRGIPLHTEGPNIALKRPSVPSLLRDLRYLQRGLLYISYRGASNTHRWPTIPAGA